MNAIIAILSAAGVVGAYFALRFCMSNSLEKQLRAADCHAFTPSTLPEGTFTPVLVTIGNLQFESNLTVQLYSEGVAVKAGKELILIPYSRLKPIKAWGYSYEIIGSKLRVSFGEVDDLIGVHTPNASEQVAAEETSAVNRPG